MTSRQSQILKAIVEVYAESAEPVSSQQLAIDMPVSSATVRAEMAELERLGLIYQPHTSSGRVPTDAGYRTYVNELSDVRADGRLSQALARRIKSAGEVNSAVKQATESLAQVTHNLGLATLSGNWFMTGLHNLFGHPEFSGQQAHEVARLLDSLDEWLSEAAPEGRVNVFIGSENPIGKTSGASLIISRFSSPYSQHSYIGVLGPTRQDYRRVMGLVDYAGRYLEEALNG